MKAHCSAAHEFAEFIQSVMLQSDENSGFF